MPMQPSPGWIPAAGSLRSPAMLAGHARVACLCSSFLAANLAHHNDEDALPSGMQTPASHAGAWLSVDRCCRKHLAHGDDDDAVPAGNAQARYTEVV